MESLVTPRVTASIQRGGRTSAALSLAMHAVLLTALIHATAIPVVSGQPEGMTVDIIQAAPPPPAPAEEEQAPPEPEPPKPEPQRPEPLKPKPPLPKPEPRPPALPRPVAELPSAAPEPSNASGSQDSIAVAAVPPSPMAPPAASGVPSPDDALRLYGQMVWARISAHKPRGVRLPGSVAITFTVDPDGRLTAAEIERDHVGTSLGQVALDTVRRAAPFPPPPPGTSRNQMTFVIPFQFR